MPVKKLTPEVQAFIVEAVAYNTQPSRVVEMVRDRFRVKVTPPWVQHYDPTKVSGKTLAAELVELFWRHRAEFIAKCEKVAESHQMVRVAELSGLYAEAREAGNSAEARAALEQIAKEMGGMYSKDKPQKLSLTDPTGNLPGPGFTLILTGADVPEDDLPSDDTDAGPIPSEAE